MSTTAHAAPLLLVLPAFAAWSYCSEQQPGSEQNQRYVWLLLVVAAALSLLRLRALPERLEARAFDAAAGLRQRRELFVPLWLSALLVCSLPIERVLQRLLGYQLQQQLFVSQA